jgi:uncharacterized membrane protein
MRDHGAMIRPRVSPSNDDPLVRAASEWIGGPLGRHAVVHRRWWTPLRIVLAVASAVLALGVAADLPCREDSWAARDDRGMWTSLCYSDVPFLYRERGFADGQLPYRDSALEYPVLTGAVMQASAVVARLAGGEAAEPNAEALAEGVSFYDLTAVLMGVSALVAVGATAMTVVRRPWDAMLVAASPVLLLTATINWDLLAVALAGLAVLAWTRERPVAAGVLIGLGTATKLYPVLLLGPIVLLAIRSDDRRVALRRAAGTAAAAAASWVAVNLPVVLWAPEGWRVFYTFNADRGADFGSAWYAVRLLAPGLLPDRIDPLVLVAAVAALGGIVALALLAPEPPRLAQLAFLAVAAFLLVNKVWSPQYTLWLLPLAALARPRWRDHVIWQTAEVVYFVAVWWYLATLYDPDAPLISDDGYAVAIVLRVAGLLWIAGLVVRDILRPEHDVVRPHTVAVPGVPNP